MFWPSAFELLPNRGCCFKRHATARVGFIQMSFCKSAWDQWFAASRDMDMTSDPDRLLRRECRPSSSPARLRRNKWRMIRCKLKLCIATALVQSQPPASNGAWSARLRTAICRLAALRRMFWQRLCERLCSTLTYVSQHAGRVLLLGRPCHQVNECETFSRFLRFLCGLAVCTLET